MRLRVWIPAALGAVVVAGIGAGLRMGRESLVTIGSPRLSTVAAPEAPQGQQATAGPVRFAELPPPPRAPRRSAATAREEARSPARLVSVQGTAFSGVPAVALAAYERAARLLATRAPGCGLQWEDLAGIGRVESDNGLTWGPSARVSPDGTLSPPIYGPLLDGQDGMPAIPTPDAGVLEASAVWERAVGPMQFLPSTWLEYAPVATGSGLANPQNFFDAALTAGLYLCDNGGDLRAPAGLTRAIYAYNHSSSYVAIVTAWIDYYRGAGTSTLLMAAAGELPVTASAAGRSTGAAAGRRHRPSGRRAPAKRPSAPRTTTTTTAPARQTTTTTSPTSTTTTTTTTTTTVPSVTVPQVTVP